MTPPTIPGVLYWGRLPVPFVAAWSSEDAVRSGPDPLLARRPALCRRGRRGLGVPLFGKMDESRVRRVILRRSCQVCAASLGAAGYVLDTIKGTVGRDPLLSEPLACLRCFRVAIALCPGVARIRDAARAVVVRCTDYEVVVATVGAVEGGDPSLNAALARWTGLPPVGYAKYAPRKYEVLPMEWLDSPEARGAA